MTQSQELPLVPGALFSCRTILAFREIGRTKLHNDVRDGLWTKPIKPSRKCARWPASECIALNQARIAGKTDEEIRELVRKLEAARKTAGVPA